MTMIAKIFKFPRGARFVLNYLWPPWWFTGIKITSINADFTQIKVRMSLRFYNRNYVGTHFGGNLFAMTDPFYMLMLLKNLGGDFIVWDKAAQIKFVAPGRSCVYASFNLEQSTLETLRNDIAQTNPLHMTFPISVVDASGKLIATIEKQIYIRKKASSC